MSSIKGIQDGWFGIIVVLAMSGIDPMGKPETRL